MIESGETSVIPTTSLKQGRILMNIQPNRSVATSNRRRRTVLSVAIAAIATFPIAAGASGASDGPTSADTTESSLPTTAAPTAPSETPVSSDETADAVEPNIDTSIVGDVRLTFTLPTAGRTTAGP